MSETLSERLRKVAKRSPDWDLGPLLRSAADALDAKEEAFGLLLAYAECDNAYHCWNESGLSWAEMLAMFRRHGWAGPTASDTSWGQWLDELQTRALATAKQIAARGEGVILGEAKP